MISGNVPGVMVSSTYYDLREVRNQLAQFIEAELGYRPLISESPSFPIDPSVDAIENCRRRVEANADVLVLLIGDRYGTIDQQSGKSVTNLEYLAARAKGIPVYAFIEKRVLALFDVWRATPETARAGLASLGDVRLFEFIERVRTTDAVWMHGFETATDLVAMLRQQLAYVAGAGLVLQRILSRSPDRALIQSLGPRSLRLAVDQPPGWEYLLFGSVLSEEVESHRDARTEFDWGFAHGPFARVAAHEMPDYVITKMSEIRQLVDQASVLVNEKLVLALASPGTAGSVPQIVLVARQLARIYRNMIDWAAQVRRTSTDEAFGSTLEHAALLPKMCIESVGNFGPYVVTAVEEASAAVASDGPDAPRRTLSLTMDFAIDDGLPEKVNKLLEKAINETYL